MFFIGGVGNKMKEEGKFSTYCISCGSNSHAPLIHTYSYFHLFFIPLFKFSHLYTLSCPRCGNVIESMNSLK